MDRNCVTALASVDTLRIRAVSSTALFSLTCFAAHLVPAFGFNVSRQRGLYIVSRVICVFCLEFTPSGIYQKMLHLSTHGICGTDQLRTVWCAAALNAVRGYDVYRLALTTPIVTQHTSTRRTTRRLKAPPGVTHYERR